MKIFWKCSFEFAFAWYAWISPNWFRPLSFPTVPYWLTTSPLTMSSSTMGRGIGLIEFCMYISSVHLPNVPDMYCTTFRISTNSTVCANAIICKLKWSSNKPQNDNTLSDNYKCSHANHGISTYILGLGGNYRGCTPLPLSAQYFFPCSCRKNWANKRLVGAFFPSGKYWIRHWLNLLYSQVYFTAS